MTATSAEIAQQPEVWPDVATIVDDHDAALRDFLQPLLAEPGARIVLTGAGSSAFVGDLLAPALTAALGRRVDAVATTDLVASPDQGLAEHVPTLLVSFARSGNSPESIAATGLADRQLDNVRHLVITCNADGELATEHAARPHSFVLAMPPRTNDQGFAMTSSFTSMALAGWLTLSRTQQGRLRQRTAPHSDDPAEQDGTHSRSIDPDRVIDRLASAARSMIDKRSQLQAIAAHGYERVVYLGSGPLRAAAQEAALKLLELSAGNLIGHHDTPLGFRHGPKSLLSDRTLVIVFTSNDPYTRHYDEDIITEVRTAIGDQNVLVITGSAGPAEPGRWSVPELDGIDDVLIALPYLVAAQLLAHEVSQRLGLEPDNPFPGGEVNRVVQGVTVHPLNR